MKRKEYEREMRVLHGELVAMQEWVKSSGAKICIVYVRAAVHLPLSAGEVVIFDRSWHNRAGVERVMGFAGRRKPAVP